VTTVSDEVVKLGTEYIASVVGLYAVENADTFPSTVATKGTLTDASDSPLYDYWPANPWTGMSMVNSTSPGDYTYSIPGEDSFHINGHLSSGDFGFDEAVATDHIFISLYNEDDRAVEAGCQPQGLRR